MNHGGHWGRSGIIICRPPIAAIADHSHHPVSLGNGRTVSAAHPIDVPGLGQPKTSRKAGRCSSGFYARHQPPNSTNDDVGGKRPVVELPQHCRRSAAVVIISPPSAIEANMEGMQGTLSCLASLLVTPSSPAATSGLVN